MLILNGNNKFNDLYNLLYYIRHLLSRNEIRDSIRNTNRNPIGCAYSQAHGLKRLHPLGPEFEIRNDVITSLMHRSRAANTLLRH